MKLPSYQDLADLVAQLTEANIANVDTPEDRFVSCYTYGADRIPDHWWRAIEAREALIAHHVVPRGARSTNTVIRDRGGKVKRA